MRSRGGKVVLHGDSFPGSPGVFAEAGRRKKATSTFTPTMIRTPFAGRGTVAMEILRQHPGPLDAIFSSRWAAAA